MGFRQFSMCVPHRVQAECRKIGGIDRNGEAYQTRWVMNLNKCGFILKLIEAMGHTPKDRPTRCSSGSPA